MVMYLRGAGWEWSPFPRRKKDREAVKPLKIILTPGVDVGWVRVYYAPSAGASHISVSYMRCLLLLEYQPELLAERDMTTIEHFKDVRYYAKIVEL